MNAQSSLLQWLHDHPDYRACSNRRGERWIVEIMNLDFLRVTIQFGQSYEQACRRVMENLRSRQL